MPKIETFLKEDEIRDIVRKASDNELSRSAIIRAAVVYIIGNSEFDLWLRENKEELFDK